MEVATKLELNKNEADIGLLLPPPVPLSTYDYFPEDSIQRKILPPQNVQLMKKVKKRKNVRMPKETESEGKIEEGIMSNQMITETLSKDNLSYLDSLGLKDL